MPGHAATHANGTRCLGCCNRHVPRGVVSARKTIAGKSSTCLDVNFKTTAKNWKPRIRMLSIVPLLGALATPVKRGAGFVRGSNLDLHKKSLVVGALGAFRRRPVHVFPCIVPTQHVVHLLLLDLGVARVLLHNIVIVRACWATKTHSCHHHPDPATFLNQQEIAAYRAEMHGCRRDGAAAAVEAAAVCLLFETVQTTTTALVAIMSVHTSSVNVCKLPPIFLVVCG